MLSKGALKYLKPLKYDPEAERRWSLVPLGGIFWADEIPDFRALSHLPKRDRDSIFRLFSISFRLWDGDELEEDEQAYWDAARTQVPDYPLFRRVDLSPDDRKAQAATRESTIEFFDAVATVADEVSISDDGTFSATIDLTKDEPRSH